MGSNQARRALGISEIPKDLQSKLLEGGYRGDDTGDYDKVY